MGFPIGRNQAICVVMSAVLFVLSGCSGADPVAAEASASANETQEMLDYLQASRDDFKVIDELLEDESLGLLDESSSGGQEITADSLDLYLGILSDYDSRIDSNLAKIKKRPAPNHRDIAYFKTSEIAEFELSSAVVEEYIQVLKYFRFLLGMGDSMQNLGNIDITASNYKTQFEKVSKSITDATDELKNDDVPSFLKSMNDNMIAALDEMNNTVAYSLNAAELKDPLRADAAQYRMEILSRRLDKIITEYEQDMTSREAKLNGDVKNIKTKNDGLKDWLKTNIGRLGGS